MTYIDWFAAAVMVACVAAYCLLLAALYCRPEDQ